MIQDILHFFCFGLSMAFLIAIAVSALAALKWAAKIEKEDDE